MGKYLIGLLLLCSNAYAKQVRVMVLDSGIDASHLELVKYVEAGSYDDLHDFYGHGTHVAGIIAESGCPNLKIVSCKGFFVKGHGAIVPIVNCLNRAIKEHIDIINFSANGELPFDEEFQVMKKVSAAGIKINVAAGNDNKYLGSPCYRSFPACYRLDGMTIVGALDRNNRYELSNYGIPGMAWEQGVNILSTLPDNKYGKMTGTSMATAMFTRHMVQDLCYK